MVTASRRAPLVPFNLCTTGTAKVNSRVETSELVCKLDKLIFGSWKQIICRTQDLKEIKKDNHCGERELT